MFGYDPSTFLAGLWSLLHIVLVLYCFPVLILQRKEPVATTAWLFAIVFLPVIGSVIYLAFGNDSMGRRARRLGRLSRDARALVPILASNIVAPYEAGEQEPIFRLLEKINPYPPTMGNRIDVLTDMDRNFQQQIAAIDSATDHVHLEYYIFRTDKMGMRFSKAMIRAAQRGVEVRFLYDAVGGMGLTRVFLDELREAGVQVARHIPMNLFTRRWTFNFRNHRKLLVVDGKVGFVGGANIGEEYLGRSSVGKWFDMHLKVQGPAVLFMQRVFADDWAFAARQGISGTRYFAETPAPGEIVSQVIASGPDMSYSIFHELFFVAITTAKERVRLMTPYFVPTEPLRMAMETASRRGVEIEIMVPGVSTKPFVRLASQAYYEGMLDARVRILEYAPGFLHAKMLTVDSAWAMVGTPNFDSRSVRLSFEVGLVIYDVDVTSRLDAVFDEALEDCREVDRKKWVKRGRAQKFVENFAQLFSPTL